MQIRLHFVWYFLQEKRLAENIEDAIKKLQKAKARE